MHNIWSTWHNRSVSVVIFGTVYRAKGSSSLVVYSKQYIIQNFSLTLTDVVIIQHNTHAGVRARTRTHTHTHTFTAG